MIVDSGLLFGPPCTSIEHATCRSTVTSERIHVVLSTQAESTLKSSYSAVASASFKVGQVNTQTLTFTGLPQVNVVVTCTRQRQILYTGDERLIMTTKSIKKVQ